MNESVDTYIESLPDDRGSTVRAVRDVLLRSLPDGYRESMSSGMITYEVPPERLPRTYNGKPLIYVALAAQRRYISLYLMGVYGDPATAEWFRESYANSGKNLSMGKSCLRFKNLDDLPLDLVSEAVARIPLEKYVADYDAAQGRRRSRRVS